jgi:hypothetical protein
VLVVKWSRHFAKEILTMKKIVLCIVLLLSIGLFVSCSSDGTDTKTNDESILDKADGNESDDKKKETLLDKMLDSVGVESIEWQETSRSQMRYGVRVDFTCEIPNYAELFKAALAEKNPDRALRNAIKNKEYTTVSYSDWVTVEYVDGEAAEPDPTPVIKSFIEKELINAINSILEEEVSK